MLSVGFNFSYLLNTQLNSATASNAPTHGATIGIQAYDQLEGPFPFIGRIACAKRGPKSLAGLIA